MNLQLFNEKARFHYHQFHNIIISLIIEKEQNTKAIEEQDTYKTSVFIAITSYFTD